MLPSGLKNFVWFAMLKKSHLNSIRVRSLMLVLFCNDTSELLSPGPQQIVRGEFPNVPKAESWNELGSNARLFAFFRGSSLLNGATKSGSPADEKSMLLVSS